MRILYDHQIFTSQKYGGVSRYFYELINFFNHEENIDVKTSIIFSNNYYISNKKDVYHIGFFPNNAFKGKQRVMSKINEINSIINLKKQNFDVFHPTNYNPYFIDYIEDKPFVVTIYDMIHEKLSSMFSVDNTTTEQKKLLCSKASKIIAISKNTKKDLIELFNIEESKIEVIHLANSLILDDQMDMDIPEKYILFVGSRDGYKNFYTFINSISLLLNEDLGLLIVCAGGGEFNSQELLLFKKLNIETRVLQFNLTDKVLAQFYAKALLFVFPSLYEGFGIPILESFSCSCPLVCSNTSSFPEIAGNAAEYFDPYCEESIYMAVKKVLYSTEDKEKLIKNGTERLKLFSWQKTAEQTKMVYENVFKRNITKKINI